MDAGSDGKLCLRQAGLRPRFGKGLPHLVHELAVWTASSRHGGHRPRRNGVPSIALGAQAKLLPATHPPPNTISMPLHLETTVRCGPKQYVGTHPRVVR